jgi:hypothetical protein
MKLTRHVYGDSKIFKKLLPLLSEDHQIRIDSIPTILTLTVLGLCVPQVLRPMIIHLLTKEFLVTIDAVLFGQLHL